MKASPRDSGNTVLRLWTVRGRATDAVTHRQVVDGQEGLGLKALLLQVEDAAAGGLLRRHHDGVEVAAQHLGDSQLVLAVDGAAQVHQPAVLGRRNLCLASARCFVHRVGWNAHDPRHHTHVPSH